MKTLRWLGGCLALVLVGPLWAQTTNSPRLLYVMPAGGQAGSTVEITITGQDLDDAQGLHFNFPGVTVERLGSEKPPPVDAKAKKPSALGKPMPAQVSHRFKITLPSSAPVGIQDVRVVTKSGVSNPRAFVVGDGHELLEKEPNNDVGQAQRADLNSTVHGVILQPTDVDYFLFQGKKGQRIVISCLTTSIDSKLPAVLDLYSISGTLLGSNRGYQGNDAVLDAMLPDDGDYYVRLHGFTYTQGGPDFFYRLTIGTSPWIDAVFPSIVEAGKESVVTVIGRNLPEGRPVGDMHPGGRALESIVLKVKPTAAAAGLALTGFVAPPASFADGFEVRLRGSAGSSNGYLLHVAGSPVVKDDDGNDSPATAQRIQVPCVVAGRIEKKADVDWYAFSAKKGDALSIELFGDRLGSPMDLVLQLRNAKGTVITDQDDSIDIVSPQFFTQTSDPPRYRFVPSADGEYHVMVTGKEAFTHFGLRHLYHLRIAPEQPDFRLVAMPTSLISPEGVAVGRAGQQAYTVYVQALDGFNSDITIMAEGLPKGVTFKSQIIPAGVKQTAVVVGAAADAADWTGPIRLVGTASISGKKVTREARAATITWPVQQVTPTITRLDRELVLAVRDKPPFSLAATIDKIVVQPGERITIPVKLERLQPNFQTTVQVTSLAVPQGLVVQPLALTPGKDSGNVVIDTKQTVPPGVYSLVLRGTTGPVQPKPQPKPGDKVLSLPASPVLLTILPKSIAKLKVDATIPRLAPGESRDLPVEVARLMNYDGPFKVELIIPKDVKGLQAPAAQIKAGENATKLVVSASADAPVGVARLIVRLTANYQGIAVVQDSKLSVNVVP